MGVKGWQARRATVASNFLFANLTSAELDKVLALARVTHYAPRQIVWRKGDSGNGMMAVLSGHVKLSAGATDGRDLAFNIVKPGEIFGEIALLDGQERAVDATALDACDILFIDRRDFVPFLVDHPEISIRLMTALCTRLRRTSQMVEDSALALSPRLARNLLHLADCHGRPAAGGGLHIDLGLSQRELGELIGMSRESVNKQLGRWRRQGLIDVERRRILIRDLGRLKRMADTARAIN